MLKSCSAAPTRKQQELNLLSSRAGLVGSNAQRGVATWIASGITIEEMQIALCMDIRQLSRHPTKTQNLDISRRQTKLQNRIDEYTITAATHLSDGFDMDDDIRDMDLDFMANDSGCNASDAHDTDSEPAPIPTQRPDLFHPEHVTIPLPSNIGTEQCVELGVEHLVDQEIALREGQANDTLQAIRVLLADKAVLFRTTVRPVKSQAKLTRAWTQVRSVKWVIRLNAMIYTKCQAQMENLQAHGLLEKYLRMDKSHLKATAAVAEPNARGQYNAALPWFWSLNVQGDSVSSNWMNECGVPFSGIIAFLLIDNSL
jgi:hypothetical protein